MHLLLLALPALAQDLPAAEPAAAEPAPVPAPAPPALPARERANLEAFARLYGVLRFFHPSDEAAATDWARFAVAGVRAVRSAPDDAALAAALRDLIAPVAPTARILADGDPAPAPPTPPAEPHDVVAWQYRGPGIDGIGGTYAGQRTARDGVWWPPSPGWASVSQAVDVAGRGGQPFRLTARVRAEGSAGAGAWARVDLPDGGVGFFDNMADRMVRSPDWQAVVIEGVIAEGAARLTIGGLVDGRGTAGFDAFTLEIGGEPVPLADPSFEADAEGWSTGVRPSGRGPVPGYTLAVAGPGADGAAALTLASLPPERVPGDLLDVHAAIGEVAEVPLGSGLRAWIPLALPSTVGPDAHTLTAATAAPVPPVAPESGDADLRLADVVAGWAVLEQFYPYFGDVDVDWAGALGVALDAAADDAGPDDHLRTLQTLVAPLVDGHAAVQVPGAVRADAAVAWAFAEGALVVTASGVEGVAVGDVIGAIDGVPAAEALAAEEARYSGSPQWRRSRALAHLGAGPAGTAVVLTVDGADGPRDVPVPRTGAPDPTFPHPPLATLDGGVRYVDLSRADPKDLAREARALARSPGVVFDLRGYPNGTDGVLRHLLEAPERDRWMHVPERTHPVVPGGPRPIAGTLDLGWDLRPKGPRLEVPVVFLTGGGAISYAESVMGYVEALGLPIVGGPTAGANGNIVDVALPSGASFWFTGMRVTRHDGTPSHGVGIRPTVPVEPTVAGLRAGRDEVLEAALRLIVEGAVRPR
jgi:hypothetical protein